MNVCSVLNEKVLFLATFCVFKSRELLLEMLGLVIISGAVVTELASKPIGNVIELHSTQLSSWNPDSLGRPDRGRYFTD